jgi:hypothetical protein
MIVISRLMTTSFRQSSIDIGYYIEWSRHWYTSLPVSRTLDFQFEIYSPPLVTKEFALIFLFTRAMGPQSSPA